MYIELKYDYDANDYKLGRGKQGWVCQFDNGNNNW